MFPRELPGLRQRTGLEVEPEVVVADHPLQGVGPGSGLVSLDQQAAVPVAYDRGESADGGLLLKKYGFTAENVVTKARESLEASA